MLWLRNIIYYMLWASWGIRRRRQPILPGGVTTYSVFWLSYLLGNQGVDYFLDALEVPGIPFGEPGT
jgi:hypothetical protein